jgi:hypothetical protein
MHRRNFLKLGVGSAAATALVALVPIKPYDPWQAFLDRIGNKVHGLVLREGRPMESVVIEPPFEMNGKDYYRLVRVYLKDQVQPHKWFELVTY